MKFLIGRLCPLLYDWPDLREQPTFSPGMIHK